ncbi:MAG: peptide chain release factor N(5)-glutamine methyltransferase [Verrucomicrobia bacterium]|nr:peptide chain release factor N(5)-glutamine methyltransferase [Verrucomicrobiota bacterium]
MTVLEVIQRSAEYLAKRGVDSPRLQAELLLAHVLRIPRLELYLRFERVLSNAELQALRDLVKRRGARIPLQHLLGSVSFCGLALAVNPSVLIPRPETELLAEQAWRFLARLTAETGAAPAALDFGTGSGCLAITLAVNCPGVRVTALDLSLEALAVARLNASSQGVSDQLDFLHGDGFAALPEGRQFNLIVTNPPYIPRAEIARLQPEVRDHDPRLALDGGEDGLDFFRRLAAEAPRFLRPDGRLLAEFGDGQAERVAGLFAGGCWKLDRVEPDLTGRPRFLLASKDAKT